MYLVYQERIIFVQYHLYPLLRNVKNSKNIYYARFHIHLKKKFVCK